MKKFKMNPLYKIGGILLSAVVLVLSIYLLYIQVTDVPTITIEENLFEGTIVPRATYMVSLKENKYFDRDELEPGGVYVRNLVKNVQVTLGASYTGSKQAQLKGGYQIYARVSGYQGSQENKEIIWSKDFPLEEKSILATDQTIKFEKKLEIDLSEYDNLTSEVSNDFGVSLTYDLTIHLEGELQVESTEGSINLPITASVFLPLKSNLFNIQANSNNVASDSIMKSVEAVDVDAPNYIPLCILGIILGIFGCIIFIFFIRRPNKEEMRKDRWIRCLRDYKSRMVKLSCISSIEFLHQYRIEFLQDMVKLSDEMRIPIFYIGDEEQAIADGFLFIIHQNDIYIHVLK